MKCKKCKNDKIRILGEEYCPKCLGSSFNVKKHSGEKHIAEKSIRAILWGVASSFLATLSVILFFRIFLLSIEIPTILIVFLGIFCFGLPGVITVVFDGKYYMKDNFIISLIFSLTISTIEWYSGSTSYLMTFFSSLMIFFITISLGSLFYKAIANRE